MGEALVAYKESYKLKNEKKYWDDVCRQAVLGGVPGDRKEPTSLGSQSIQVVIDETLTKQLVSDAHRAYNTEINDLLLSAVNMAFYCLTGQKKLTVGLEGHGREEIHEPIQIDCTVGWFTISYPVVLDCCGAVEDAVVKTKELLRKIPNHGFGYGLLHEPDEMSHADVYFNYMGQMDSNEEGIVYTAGENISQENQLPGDILFNGVTTQDKLIFTLIYNSNRYSEQMIQSLADLFKAKLVEIITYLTEQESETKTISDYGSVSLQESEFDEIMDLFE